MTDEELKQIVKEGMETLDEELERVMEIINNDPTLKDVKCPEEVHDKLFAQIREYEEQKRLANLTDEEREWIRYGKIYKKRHKWSRVAVLIAATVVVLAVGTVSIGEDKDILSVFKKIISGEERTEISSDSIEPTVYIEEEELYEKIEEEYNFMPVKLDYLPIGTTFVEGVFGSGIQNISMAYKTDDGASILYVIRPNYREGSLGTVVEDKKMQEYTMSVQDIAIDVTEYTIIDSGQNRWSISFTYRDVQYLLRITNMSQKEVTKIIENLGFQPD